jgi:hypothetical protein
MEKTKHEPLDPDTVVHRIGGGSVENLRLKAKETTLKPPGISVFIGGSPAFVAEQVRRTFPNATHLLKAAGSMGTSTVAAIREVGFDVVADPTRHFANHARLTHPDDTDGFNDANLGRLSKAFTTRS